MGLRQQAKLDARAILEDTSGFAWPVTLTSPLGAITSLLGFTTDVGQTIDPETGQAVAGRRASCTVPRAALPSLPEAVAEKSRKPWLAAFPDSEGVPRVWKVIEVLPDAAIGVVVLLLEEFQRAIVRLTGALVLPMLQLSGTVEPEVEIAGALELPMLELSGTVEPEVELAGALALPSGIALSGSFSISFNGALALPMLELSGTVEPEVEIAGALALPSGIALSGSFTLDQSVVTAMLDAANATDTGTLTIPDSLGGPSQTQATASRKPSIGVSGNGQPIVTFVDDWLNQAPGSANNSSPRNGLAFWMRPSSIASTYTLFAAWLGVGTGSSRLIFRQEGANLALYVYVTSNNTQRKAVSTSSPLEAATWKFATYEYDGGQTAEADKAVITVDNVKLTLTFSDAEGSPGAMPATLRTFGTNCAYGNQNTAFPSQLYGGDIAGLTYWLGGPGGLSGGGLLSSAQRNALMLLRRPF